MNLYLLTQDTNTGYDTFDSCVVVAETEDQARLIHPEERVNWLHKHNNCWPDTPDQVQVQLIGTASPGLDAGKVLCASFNAG